MISYDRIRDVRALLDMFGWKEYSYDYWAQGNRAKVTMATAIATATLGVVRLSPEGHDVTQP